MATSREELLKLLKIETKPTAIADVTKLEHWYLENISRQPLFDSLAAIDKKLSLLDQQITDYFSTVATIPLDKSGEASTKLDGMSAIQYASKKGFDIYLNAALREKPEAVNQATKAKLTPLHLAALYGHQISCALLLQYGADLKLETKLGQIPLEHALILMPSYGALNLQERKLRIFETLVKTYPQGIIHRDISDNTIAHYAVENNFPFIIEKLIHDNPRVLDLKNSSGHTPLHVAILNKKEECVNLLTRVSTSLGIADKENRLPIHYAAMYSNSAILKAVITPTHLNALDTNLRTPVMLAAQRGNLNAVKLLVENHANISLTDKYGFNLFHHAVMSLNLELVQWLVQHTEINTSQQDQYGRTPLMNLLNEYKLKRSDIKELVDYLVNINTKEELVDKYGKSLSQYLPESRSQLSA